MYLPCVFQVKVWLQNRRTKHKRVQSDDEQENSQPGGPPVKRPRLDTNGTGNESDDGLESDIDVEDDDDDVDINSAESAFFAAQFHRGSIPRIDAGFQVHHPEMSCLDSAKTGPLERKGLIGQSALGHQGLTEHSTVGHQGLTGQSRTTKRDLHLERKDYGPSECERVKPVKREHDPL